ncbi:hypothetical protein D3C73_1380460 [compost metagenome]
MEARSAFFQRQILVVIVLHNIDNLLRDIMVLRILPAVEDADHRQDDDTPEPVLNLGDDMQIGQLLEQRAVHMMNLVQADP